MDRPTRLTSSGPIGGPSHSRLSSAEAPTGPTGDAYGSAGGLEAVSTSDLSPEQETLLNDAEFLEEQLRSLSGALESLASYSSGTISERASDLAARVRRLANDTENLRREIAQEGALPALKGALRDYEDIAESISATAQSLRSAVEGGGTGGDSSASEPESSASAPVGGGTATALMIFGGIALTGWAISRESGSSSDEEDSGPEEESGGILPAGGALIGQY